MRRSELGIAAACLVCVIQAFGIPCAAQQSGTTASPLSNGAVRTGAGLKPADADTDAIGDFPKVSVSTLANLEGAGFAASSGPGRGPSASLRFDSTALVNLSDDLSVDGLFQFKPRQPLRADDPNNELFINQGAGRREGGKVKELYVRYGNYRVGKFVQNFGRAYLLLPGPYAADFIEEAEQGYEPTEMVGGEWIHVFDGESGGWRQLSLSTFMVDRTFLHRSFPYDEGVIHFHDGGVGNTRFPTNVMATYDVLNMPVGNWAQLTWQASAIRFGRTYATERGEIWGTLNGDLAIPLRDSIASTLQRDYAQLHLYVEAVRRQNFQGAAGRARDYLSASAEYLSGSWIFDATTTQRWTSDRVAPLQKDSNYTATIGYRLPTQTIVSVSVADEWVGERRGIYAGIRLTQTFTTCNRCQVRGVAY